VYLESADGARGLYITTYRFAPEDGYSNSAAVEHVQAIERQAFQNMKDYIWQVMFEERCCKGGVEIAVMDCYAKASSYRIACKVIASLPWVVRATLHDYDCADWASSREEYHELLSSIEMHR
jgi:hypothetical protein